jgi:hypothetical protein
MSETAVGVAELFEGVESGFAFAPLELVPEARAFERSRGFVHERLRTRKGLGPELPHWISSPIVDDPARFGNFW